MSWLWRSSKPAEIKTEIASPPLLIIPTHSSLPLVESEPKPEPERIQLHLPTRAFLLPGCLGLFGFALGIVRGGRATSLRFLAENAHRPPRTKQASPFPPLARIHPLTARLGMVLLLQN